MPLNSSARRGGLLVILLLAFASTAAAQQWQIIRAEYGVGNRWVDVTPRLQQLARTNRQFRMGNDTFGIDPAPGQRKSLRIFARDSRGRTRTFDYPEGSVVDGARFTDWTSGNFGRGGGGFGGGQYQILRADYGAGRQMVDVTARLRELSRGNSRVRVGNEAFGFDPAPNRVKTLRIQARGPRGDTRTFNFREGSILDGSQFSDWGGGGFGGRRP